MKDWMKIPLGIIIGLAIAAIIQIVTSPPRGTPIMLTPAPTTALIVQVDGAVTKPGIYSLSPGSRVSDAITAAGGLIPEAQADSINLVRMVKDGESIHIPSVNSAQPQSARSTSLFINLNTATLNQLDSLPGIGEIRAQAILQYRADHGNFVTIEEVLQVPGISQDVFEQIRDLITVE